MKEMRMRNGPPFNIEGKRLFLSSSRRNKTKNDGKKRKTKEGRHPHPRSGPGGALSWVFLPHFKVNLLICWFLSICEFFLRWQVSSAPHFDDEDDTDDIIDDDAICTGHVSTQLTAETAKNWSKIGQFFLQLSSSSNSSSSNSSSTELPIQHLPTWSLSSTT